MPSDGAQYWSFVLRVNVHDQSLSQDGNLDKGQHRMAMFALTRGRRLLVILASLSWSLSPAVCYRH